MVSHTPARLQLALSLRPLGLRGDSLWLVGLGGGWGSCGVGILWSQSTRGVVEGLGFLTSLHRSLVTQSPRAWHKVCLVSWTLCDRCPHPHALMPLAPSAASVRLGKAGAHLAPRLPPAAQP